MSDGKSENLIQRIKQWLAGDRETERYPLEWPESRPNPWTKEMAKNWHSVADDLDSIAERTDEVDTEQELREIVTDVREVAEFYEEEYGRFR